MRQLILSFSVFSFFLHAASFACPKIEGVPDYNCNSKAKVVITGDSIVYGQGDSDNNGSGGYVKRFADDFKHVNVEGLGVPAITAIQLFRKFKEKNSKFLKAAKGADIVLLDVARNDCRSGGSTKNTLRDLKRLVKFIRNNAGTANSQPFVMLATQIPNRNYRRTCIEALNRSLLAAKSQSLPVYLRFDTLSAGILSEDGLHPSSSGYEVMEDALEKFFKKKLLSLIKRVRPDTDADHIYDFFEILTYGTNPELSDTDGDGKIDGHEVFEFGTNPLVID